MSNDIDLDALDQLVADGAVLIEVLPEGEYNEEHLPGAINVLSRNSPGVGRNLDRAKPVVVYRWDSL
ncbi:MAG: rhodanese-like domain-containing protein [Microthrixaceae bacterium]